MSKLSRNIISLLLLSMLFSCNSIPTPNTKSELIELLKTDKNYSFNNQEKSINVQFRPLALIYNNVINIPSEIISNEYYYFKVSFNRSSLEKSKIAESKLAHAYNYLQTDPSIISFIDIDPQSKIYPVDCNCPRYFGLNVTNECLVLYDLSEIKNEFTMHISDPLNQHVMQEFKFLKSKLGVLNSWGLENIN